MWLGMVVVGVDVSDSKTLATTEGDAALASTIATNSAAP